MKIIKSKVSLKKYLTTIATKKLGFVPTMGYLHAGHLKLVKQSLKENERTLVSIFVNPTQFGPKEDLTTYPRNTKKDLTSLRRLKVDAVFLPTPNTIYSDQQTFIRNITLDQLYCGKTRPIFFQGVLTVVMKFFLMIRPNTAYFGEKDYQQLFLIKKMVSDFDLDIKIKSVAIQREKNGLAMSSRNAYLKNLDQAALFYQVLKEGKRKVREHVLKTPSTLVRWLIKELLNKSKNKGNKNGGQTSFKIDYLVVVDRKTLQEIPPNTPLYQTNPSTIKKPNSPNPNPQPIAAIILGAVYFEKVRLIDNLII